MFIGMHILRPSALGLQRWFSGQECLLLYQRTKAWNPASRSGTSQKPVTPAPRSQCPLLASVDTCVYTHTHTCTHARTRVHTHTHRHRVREKRKEEILKTKCSFENLGI